MAAVIDSLNLGVTGPQVVVGKDYRGPFPHFVSGDLIDICLPAAAYNLLLRVETILQIPEPWAAKSCVVDAVISLAQIAQYCGRPILSETDDPWVPAAHATGALPAAATDAVLFPRLFTFWRLTHEMERPGP